MRKRGRHTRRGGYFLMMFCCSMCTTLAFCPKDIETLATIASKNTLTSVFLEALIKILFSRVLPRRGKGILSNCLLVARMSLPSACCTIPPVESNYVPKGKEVSVGDLTVYETGDEGNPRLLICHYDIFGFHPTTKQVCDKLGGTGFRVVMPDFFRGNPFLLKKFPPADRQVLLDFVGTTGSWDKVVKPDMELLIAHYKGQGVKNIGVFGFCWGGKMSLEESAAFPKDLQAAALVHPAFITTEDADRVAIPVLSLPSKDDSDMVPFNDKVKAKFGEDGSGHHRFEDMHHGFCAARGDLEDEQNRKRVDEALALMHTFFNKNLK